jgi:hypothetical protein
MAMLIHKQNLWLQPVRPSYPALDEEYFEWLDVLKTVDGAKSMESSGVAKQTEITQKNDLFLLLSLLTDTRHTWGRGAGCGRGRSRPRSMGSARVASQ